MKPILRLTIGPVRPAGFDVLKKSIEKLALFNLDLIICHNNLNDSQLSILKSFNVPLLEQKWNDCPISVDEQHSDCEAIGSLWKICPPRLDVARHEIIMDNDIIINKIFPELETFLNNSNKNLILEETVRYYGIFDKLIKGKFSSGFIGFYPGYDFAAKIREIAIPKKSLTNADEQGLLVSVLQKSDYIKISKNKILKLRTGKYLDRIHKFKQKDIGYHFVGINRVETHDNWKEYEFRQNN